MKSGMSAAHASEGAAYVTSEEPIAGSFFAGACLLVETEDSGRGGRSASQTSEGATSTLAAPLAPSLRPTFSAGALSEESLASPPLLPTELSSSPITASEVLEVLRGFLRTRGESVSRQRTDITERSGESV